MIKDKTLDSKLKGRELLKLSSDIKKSCQRPSHPLPSHASPPHPHPTHPHTCTHLPALPTAPDTHLLHSLTHIHTPKAKLLFPTTPYELPSSYTVEKKYLKPSVSVFERCLVPSLHALPFSFSPISSKFSSPDTSSE